MSRAQNVLNMTFKAYLKWQFISSFKIQPSQSVLNIFLSFNWLCVLVVLNNNSNVSTLFLHNLEK